MLNTIEPLTIPAYRLFLKYTGIFPTDFSLVLPQAKNCWTVQAEILPEDVKWGRKLKYITSGPFTFVSRIQVTVCITQVVLSIFSVIHSMWISNAPRQEVVSLICWFGPMFCGTLFGIKTYAEGPKIFEIIMRLVAVEEHIMRMYIIKMNFVAFRAEFA